MSRVKIIFLIAFLSNIVYSQTIEIEDWKICALKITSYTELRIRNSENGIKDTFPVSKRIFNDSCLMIERQYDFRKTSLKSPEFEHTSMLYKYDSRGNLKSTHIQKSYVKVLDGVYISARSECRTYDKSGNILSIEYSFDDGDTGNVVYTYTEFSEIESVHIIKLPTKVEHFHNGELVQMNVVEYTFKEK